LVVLGADVRMGRNFGSTAGNRHHVATADQGISLFSILDCNRATDEKYPISLITKIYYGLGYHLLIHNISDSLDDLKRGIMKLVVFLPRNLSPI